MTEATSPNWQPKCGQDIKLYVHNKYNNKYVDIEKFNNFTPISIVADLASQIDFENKLELFSFKCSVD